MRNNVVSSTYAALLVYRPGVTGIVRDFTITGNQLAVTDPTFDYRVVLLDNVGGTSTFAANTVAVTGTPAGGVTQTNGMEVRGAGSGAWTIGGSALADKNQFLGNSKTPLGQGIRLRATLPASFVGVIKKNDITGWDKAIWSETLAGGVSITALHNNISGNVTYGTQNGAGAGLTANCNWWGALNGPNPPGSGNNISANVTATYWLLGNDYGEDPDGDSFTSCTSDSGGDCNQGNVAVYPGATEACNNVDDNCNGTVDEGDPGGGGTCATGNSGVCSAGTIHCVAGALACVQNQPAVTEICGNVLDDDCDGTVDEAGTRYVANGGSDTLNDCLSAGAKCATIQHAVDVACVGETIDVASGAYSENVTVPKRLTIDGAGAGSTVVTAANAAAAVFSLPGSGITGSPLTVQDLTAQGGTHGVVITSPSGTAYLFGGLESRNNTVTGIQAGAAEPSPMSR